MYILLYPLRCLLLWPIGLFLPPFSWIVHVLQGERKPNAEESEYIEPLFEELCAFSGVARNSLILRMRTDEEINAFASGLKSHYDLYRSLVFVR